MLFYINFSDTTLIGIATLASWMKLALSAYLKETGLEEVESSSLEEDQEADMKLLADEKDVNEQKEQEKLVAGDESESLEKKMAGGPVSNGNHERKEEFSSSLTSCKENMSKSTIETEGIGLFNEDIVCSHNLIDPKAPCVWLPTAVAEEMKQLCSGMIHPATFQEDFSECSYCKV